MRLESLSPSHSTTKFSLSTSSFIFKISLQCICFYSIKPEQAKMSLGWTNSKSTFFFFYYLKGIQSDIFKWKYEYFISYFCSKGKKIYISFIHSSGKFISFPVALGKSSEILSWSTRSWIIWHHLSTLAHTLLFYLSFLSFWNFLQTWSLSLQNICR